MTSSHVYSFDYTTDQVTAVFQISVHSELGFEANMNGRFEEICRKPAYTYFKNKTVELCRGESFSFDVASSNAKTFAWKKDNTLLAGQKSKTLQLTTVTTDDAGVYTCVMTNTCGTTETLGAITIQVNDVIPAPTITADGGVSFCAGGSVTLTGNTAGTWNTGETTASLTVTTTGEYSVTTSSSCGNEKSNVIEVAVNPLPVIETPPQDRDVLAGETATFEVTAQNTSDLYQWQVNTGDGFTDIADHDHYAGATTPTLQVVHALETEDGYQYRCVLTEGTCPGASDVATLHVSKLPDPPIPVGTEESVSASAFLIHPNPVADVLYLTLPEGAVRRVAIRDMLGRTIYTSASPKDQIQTTPWTAGMYTVEVATSTQSYQARFIKK